MSDRIYIASKTKHARVWKSLRASGIPIISTWIDEAGPGETEDFGDLWERCINEAKTATALLAYRESPEDILKGAFVEIGAALASGVPVFAVGLGGLSFMNHRLVTECKDVADALCQIGGMP